MNLFFRFKNGFDLYSFVFLVPLLHFNLNLLALLSRARKILEKFTFEDANLVQSLLDFPQSAMLPAKHSAKSLNTSSKWWLTASYTVLKKMNLTLRYLLWRSPWGGCLALWNSSSCIQETNSVFLVPLLHFKYELILSIWKRFWFM